MDGLTGKLTSDRAGGWVNTTGWTDQPDPARVTFGACGESRISFGGQLGQQAKLTVRETKFQGADGTQLAGRLVLPAGEAPAPITVIVHGSENTSARLNYFQQRAWPAHGVGVFVYDKRGTGDSKGKYTQDFSVLARDGAAAVAEARRLAGSRAARVGVEGGSQGSWIGPLVATLTPVDYVIALYGLAESPLAENRGEVLQDLADKGHGPDVLAKGGEVADITGKIMASNYRSGWDELAAIRKRYGREPWFKDLNGEFTGDFLRYPAPVLRVAGPFLSKGTTWNHDPVAVIRKVDAPMLWVLAGQDRDAPVEETRRRLVALAAEDRRITVLEFPATDHGMREFKIEDGERRYTRYADGYYRAVLDFARDGKLSGDYADGTRLTRY